MQRSSRNKFYAVALLALAGVSPLSAQELDLSSSSTAEGQMMVGRNGGGTFLVGIAPATEDVGKTGSVFVIAKNAFGDERYVSPRGVSDTPSPFFSGKLLESMTWSIPVASADRSLSPEDAACQMLFAADSGGGVGIDVAYSLGGSAKPGGAQSRGVTALQSVDKLIAVAKELNMPDEVAKAEATKSRLLQMNNDYDAAMGAVAPSASDTTVFEIRWAVLDLTCN